MVKSLLQFYLDYVGCKAQRNTRADRSRNGFISTMWDVKVSQKENKVVYSLGFISTMWDVKPVLAPAKLP